MNKRHDINGVSHVITLVNCIVVFRAISDMGLYYYLTDVKLSLPPPMNFAGEVDLGRGSRPPTKLGFFGPDRKLLPTCPTSIKSLPLHF